MNDNLVIVNTNGIRKNIDELFEQIEKIMEINPDREVFR